MKKIQVMMFYRSLLQKASRQPASIHIITCLPLSSPPLTVPLREPAIFKYLVLFLDPDFTKEAAKIYMCPKINAAHETVAAVEQNLWVEKWIQDKAQRGSEGQRKHRLRKKKRVENSRGSMNGHHYHDRAPPVFNLSFNRK